MFFVLLGHKRLPETPSFGDGWQRRPFSHLPLTVSTPDTILPNAKGSMTLTLVLLGLSAPVPRGRKGKKVKAQSTQPVVQDADWLASCNPDALFQEDSYKKHLKHHCNK